MYIHLKWLTEKLQKWIVHDLYGLKIQGKYKISMDHHKYNDTGVIGDPFKASPEKGEKLFERFAEHLAKFIEEIKKINVEVKNREFINRA